MLIDANQRKGKNSLKENERFTNNVFYALSVGTLFLCFRKTINLFQMNTKQNKTALVTGATSGIGYELAKLFAKNGYDLLLVSRSQDVLDDIAMDFNSRYGVNVYYFAIDLFVPGAAEQLYQQVKQRGMQVDILVNDAGQGVYGKFTETNLYEELNIIQLNIISLVVLTKLFLQDMVDRGEGKILQVASMVSKVSSPLMAVYAGTKAFVYNFTQSVINELKDTGVTMTALLPGATDTDFFNKAGAENTKMVKEGKLDDPADVAKDGYDALMEGESKIISGMKNKVQAAIANVVPDQVIAAKMRDMNEEADKEEGEEKIKQEKPEEAESK